MPFDSDKMLTGLASEYRVLFESMQYRPVRVLEIGVWRGESLRFWAHFFCHPESVIVGIDKAPPETQVASNVRIYRCDQNDTPGLRTIADEHGPFDLVIDDGSHFARETENCFRVLFDYVAPGGYYVIEDWAVGYWRHEPAYAGMIEVVTDIVRRIPELRIEGCRILLAPGKAAAFFRRGLQGWAK
jgi:cephalosporin hydroxylase